AKGVEPVREIGSGKEVTTPSVEIRESDIPGPKNQRLPSGPAMIGAPTSATGNSVMSPVGVILPIKPSSPPTSLSGKMNQRFPSGPAVMPPGPTRAPGTRNRRLSPLGVILSIMGSASRVKSSVNQRLPSGPAAIPPIDQIW